MSFIRFVRAAIAVSLIILLAAIVRYFLVRPPGGVPVPVKSGQLTQQKIEKKEGIEHVQVKGAEASISVKADRNYAGKDGNYYLEGHVEVTFFKRKDGQDVHLSGEEVAYDKDWNHVRSTGQAKARFKELVIDSDRLHYDNKKEVFRTESGVRFFSPKLSGLAREMVYLMKQERIELRGDVRLEMRPNLETSFPLEIRGDRFEYSEKMRKGAMQGRVQLFHGRSQASSDVLRFQLLPDGENIESLLLRENVKAVIIEEEAERDTAQQKPSSFFGEVVSRELEADELKLKAFSGLSRVEEMAGSGDCSLKFFSSDGSTIHIRAEVVNFLFDPQGQVENFMAEKKARAIKQDKDGSQESLFEGETLTFSGRDEVLRVEKGRGMEEARMSSAASDILAGEIAVDTRSNNLEARERVKAILKAGEEEKKQGGIFSGEQAVFLAARELRYFDDQKRFLFSGEVRAWQEKKTLTAEEIELFEETGNVSCRGGVTFVIPHQPEEGEEGRLEISSAQMNSRSEDNRVSFQGNCSLGARGIQLRSRSIVVHLEEDGRVGSIVAREEVAIVHSLGEARGGEARYNPETEVLILSGNAVFTDSNKGTTEADKLTFYLADGRILVENISGERSVSILKRER